MPHGLPDDADVVVSAPVIALQDMGELAVRVGSPVIYDRFGNVVMMEDWSCGEGRWYHLANTAYNYVYLSSSHFRSAGVSALIVSGVGGEDHMDLIHRGPPLVPGKVGMSFLFHWNNNVADLRWQLQVERDNVETLFSVRVNRETEAIEYLDVNGNFVELEPSVGIGYTYGLFRFGKLVVDTEAMAYIRFSLDDVAYSLAVAGWITGTPLGVNRVDAWVEMHQKSGVTAHIYVDNIILTQNEV